MSALPEQYRKYAAPNGQRPTHAYEVELYDEREPIVWVPDAYGTQMVPMRKSQMPAPMVQPEPRDLTPQPLFDPLAQRMAGGGILGAGVGWGVAQLVDAIAAAGAGLIVFALLLVAARAMGGRTVVHVRQEVHNHAKWFGRNDTYL